MGTSAVQPWDPLGLSEPQKAAWIPFLQMQVPSLYLVRALGWWGSLPRSSDAFGPEAGMFCRAHPSSMLRYLSQHADCWWIFPAKSPKSWPRQTHPDFWCLTNIFINDSFCIHAGEAFRVFALSLCSSDLATAVNSGLICDLRDRELWKMLFGETGHMLHNHRHALNNTLSTMCNTHTLQSAHHIAQYATQCTHSTPPQNTQCSSCQTKYSIPQH